MSLLLRAGAAGLALCLLAACAEQPATVANTPPPHHPPQAAPSPVAEPPPPAHIQKLPGINGVIGADARELGRQFGPARLDVWEGDARKLQFGDDRCVLDIYLYPSPQDGEPRATYVDARRNDGHDTDRARCIADLRK